MRGAQMPLTWITADSLGNPTSEFAGDAAEAASWVLFRLSGQKYPGIGVTTEWYGYDHLGCWCNNGLTEVTLRAHNIMPILRTNPPTQLRLRHKPVQSVERVTTGEGDLVQGEDFVIANDAYLLRTNRGAWDFETGVEVEYTYGTLPPAMGRQAAIALANQLVLAYEGSDNCTLPDRVTSVSRQGVSLTILDPQDFLKEGRTGIYEVDLFLSVSNPTGAQKRAKVFSPDKPRGERRR
jgi:hypothetical protein